MNLSIVIVNWNTRDLLLDCLTSIRKTVTALSHEIWVVDNASADHSVEAVSRLFPEVLIIQNDHNLGFAGGNNVALRRIAGDYALLLNTDTVLTPGAVDELFRFMEQTPKAAAACGQLLNRDHSRQNSIANFPALLPLVVNETVLRILAPARYPSKRREYLEPIEVDSCIGACMMVRKKAMDEVGLLDEAYFFYFEETDWALRMKLAGWRIFFVPAARIYHLQGQSAGYNARARIMFHRSRSIYFRKWRPWSHPVMIAVCMLRLLVNVVLNLLAASVTLGLNEPCRGRLVVNAKILLWYLRGCPAG